MKVVVGILIELIVAVITLYIAIKYDFFNFKH